MWFSTVRNNRKLNQKWEVIITYLGVGMSLLIRIWNNNLDSVQMIWYNFNYLRIKIEIENLLLLKQVLLLVGKKVKIQENQINYINREIKMIKLKEKQRKVLCLEIVDQYITNYISIL
jgi:hypothetical protein